MFLDSEKYLPRLKKLLLESKSIDIAVAFWGAGAEKLLTNLVIPTRVICNLTSGATNPSVIKSLQSHGITVKHLPDLHAKVFLGHDSAIIGSANCSANGLSLEGDEINGWQEAGYVITSEHDIDQTREWFAERWNTAEVVDDRLLEEAEIVWKKRSKNRIKNCAKSESFLSMPLQEIARRGIVLAFWRAAPTEEGNECAEIYQSKHQAQILEHYEDWFGMLQARQGDIPGHTVLDVYIGPRGGNIEVSGPFDLIYYEEQTRKKNPDKGKIMSLHFGVPLKELTGFDSKEIRAEIAEAVKKAEKKRSSFLPRGAISKVLSLEEFITKLKSI